MYPIHDFLGRPRRPVPPAVLAGTDTLVVLGVMDSSRKKVGGRGVVFMTDPENIPFSDQ